jgi:hypothetical protein
MDGNPATVPGPARRFERSPSPRPLAAVAHHRQQTLRDPVDTRCGNLPHEAESLDLLAVSASIPHTRCHAAAGL